MLTGQLVTAGTAIYNHYVLHQSWGKSTFVPTAGLGAGIVATEVSSPWVAAGLARIVPETLAASAVPGVGEFIIVGVIGFGAAWLAADGATRLWSHRGSIIHTAQQVLHKIEPWNWNW